MEISGRNTSSRVIILGAGASAFAGYPLARDLLSYIEPGLLASDQTKASLNALKFAMARLEADLPNLATLEFLLTLIELNDPFTKESLGPEPWKQEDSDRLAEVIARCFASHQEALVNDPVKRPASYDRVAAGWAAKVYPGDQILSFNWDCLHESILWEHQKWSPRDGYGFELEGTAKWPSNTCGIVFHKLHGSAIWLIKEIEDSVPMIQRARWLFLGCSNQNFHGFFANGSNRCLILPTYLKDITQYRALLTVWEQAQEALRNANELIVVGYSLHPADHLARFLLSSELDRNKTVRQITLVMKEPGYWPEFLKSLGRDWVQAHTTFEDWVCS